jgi:hypothetical protein
MLLEQQRQELLEKEQAILQEGGCCGAQSSGLYVWFLHGVLRLH